MILANGINEIGRRELMHRFAFTGQELIRKIIGGNAAAMGMGKPRERCPLQQEMKISLKNSQDQVAQLFNLL